MSVDRWQLCRFTNILRIEYCLIYFDIWLYHMNVYLMLCKYSRTKMVRYRKLIFSPMQRWEKKHHFLKHFFEENKLMWAFPPHRRPTCWANRKGKTQRRTKIGMKRLAANGHHQNRESLIFDVNISLHDHMIDRWRKPGAYLTKMGMGKSQNRNSGGTKKGRAKSNLLQLHQIFSNRWMTSSGTLSRKQIDMVFEVINETTICFGISMKHSVQTLNSYVYLISAVIRMVTEC